MPPVLGSCANLGQLRKVVRLVGDPWADMEKCERITMKLIAPVVTEPAEQADLRLESPCLCCAESV